MTLLLVPLETLINTALRFDPLTKPKLAKLAGRVIRIELDNWGLQCFCVLNTQGVQLLHSYHGDVSATIAGGPLALCDLLKRAHSGAALTGSAVQLGGDIEIIQQFSQLLGGLDIDWEEKLSHFVGDIPAHFIGQTLRRLHAWRGELKSNLCQNIRDYVQEERQLMPTKVAIDDFYNDIDALRHDVERLFTRIERLQEHL